MPIKVAPASKTAVDKLISANQELYVSVARGLLLAEALSAKRPQMTPAQEKALNAYVTGQLLLYTRWRKRQVRLLSAMGRVGAPVVQADMYGLDSLPVSAEWMRDNMFRILRSLGVPGLGAAWVAPLIPIALKAAQWISVAVSAWMITDELVTTDSERAEAVWYTNKLRQEMGLTEEQMAAMMPSGGGGGFGDTLVKVGVLGVLGLLLFKIL